VQRSPSKRGTGGNKLNGNSCLVSAKLVEIMAIIGPLIACKNLSKFSRDSADLAMLRGKSPQTLQSTKTN
jgi:hypothetical protein